MYKKRAVKRPYKKRAYKRAKISTTVKNYVKRAISVKLENKLVMQFTSGVNIGTTLIAAPTYLNLLPTIGQGTNTNARIGNRINIKSGKLQVHVSLTPFDAITNPFVVPVSVKFWVLKCRKCNSNGILTASPDIATDFFDTTSTAVGMQANFLDMQLPVNKEKYQVFAQRTFTLGVDRFGSVADFTINTTKYMKKLLHYDDSSTTVTNDNLFLISQAVMSDGRISTGYTLAKYFYNHLIQFEDA